MTVMWNNTSPTEDAARQSLWLALYFPDLGLEIHGSKANAIDPIAQAVVLLEDQRVIALNQHAVAAGLLPDTSLATARSICADIQYFRRDPAREQSRLRFLAEAMYSFSSLVSIAEPDCLILEVAGSHRLHDDFIQLQEQAISLAESLGHRVQAQLGNSAAAAAILARSGKECLAEIPVSFARLPETQRQQLISMGIRQLGQLLALPAREVGQRFGADLVHFLDRLQGRRDDPREGIVPRAKFRRQLHLLEPLRDKNALLQPMQKLLAELESWLVARQLAAARLCWQFAAQTSLHRTADTEHTDSRQTVTMPVTFGAARQQCRAFLPITQLRLEQLELPDDVMSVALSVVALEPFDTSSRGLFTGSGIADAAGLDITGRQTRSARISDDLLELQDELRARLGEQSCHQIHTISEHIPEYAWGKSTVSSSRSRSSAGTPPRPAWLFEHPQAIARTELTLLQGPERIQSGWWQQLVTRDYYLARHHNGARCWAFVDAEGRWFLHGYFA